MIFHFKTLFISFQETFTAPPSRYTKDILWAFIIVFIALQLFVIVNKT